MPSTALREQLMRNVRSLVVKVGTGVLTGNTGQLDKPLIARLGRQLAMIQNRGISVTLVTSGAVGAGMGVAGLMSRPRALPALQAAAAIGQPTLMGFYAKVLERYGLHAGQVLLTRTDFEDRARYVHIRNTIEALQRLRAIPIINENDTVAVDELDRFADNDTIAGLLTNLLRADLLVILSVVDGLLDSEGRRVDLVPRVDEEALGLVRTERSKLGSGGMGGKLAAARMVTEAGEAVVVASGRERDVLLRLLEGEHLGTIFAPAKRKISARHRWIRHAVRPAGTVALDDGAVLAVVRNGKSLLARGITRVTGAFGRGAIVALVDPRGKVIAHGKCNFSSQELEKIKGRRSSEIAGVLGRETIDEVVHRDHLALTAVSGAQ